MIEEWNKATIIGHIWNLFTKADSFSVAWGKKNLLKEKSFQQINIPQNCTHSWRKILKLRNIGNNFIEFTGGDGKSIHLQLDWWHPDGILYEKYGYRDVYDAGSKVNTSQKVF